MQKYNKLKMSFNNLSQDLKDLLFKFWSPSKEVKRKLRKYNIYLRLMCVLEASNMDCEQLIEAQKLLESCVPHTYLFRLELYEQVHYYWHMHTIEGDGFVYIDDL